jgi:bisphosphoglycerate-independent phosphoglycerate mutase (AlkP superfamily)
MIRRVLANLDLNSTVMMLTSDHGNIEDVSTRSHTLNAVPTIIWGAGSQQVANRISSLADITPAIVSLLTREA